LLPPLWLLLSMPPPLSQFWNLEREVLYVERRQSVAKQAFPAWRRFGPIFTTLAGSFNMLE
jgi:hypothetical protein